MDKAKKSTQETYIDYKDVTQIRTFLNPHARIMSRTRTGLSAREQRDLARAAKRARYMALVPYVAH